MGILNIPNEVFLSIADELPVKDLFHFLSTCSRLSSLLTPRLHKISQQDVCGYTALNWAAKRNQPSLAKLLLSSGSRVNPDNEADFPALHLAACHDSHDVIRVLVDHGATIDGRWQSGDSPAMTPLYMATLYGSAQAIRVLLELGAAIPRTCIDKKHAHSMLTHVPAEIGDVACMEAFIRHGFDFSIRGRGGRTVLHLASSAIVRSEEIMKCLLEQEGVRAIIDAQDSRGYTALHSAVCSGRWPEAEVRLLLRYGANARLKDKYGHTPADLAEERDMVGFAQRVFGA